MVCRNLILQLFRNYFIVFLLADCSVRIQLAVDIWWCSSLEIAAIYSFMMYVWPCPLVQGNVEGVSDDRETKPMKTKKKKTLNNVEEDI